MLGAIFSFFEYAFVYIFLVYGGRHLKQRFLLKKFKERPAVALHVCADVRYHSFGGFFLQWRRAHHLKKTFGKMPMFYICAAPGPSVCDSADPELVHAHVTIAVATAKVGRVALFEIHGHFDCARDPAHTQEEMERVKRSLRALRAKIQKKLPEGVKVLAYVDHRAIFGWHSEDLNHVAEEEGQLGFALS